MKHSGRPTLETIPVLQQLKEKLAREREGVAEAANLTEPGEIANKVDISAEKIAADEGEAQRRRQLRRYLESRGVVGLVHFTRLSNLLSILNNGLLPRSELDQSKIQYDLNDSLRLDGVDGVCCTVMFPNYKLFYKFRRLWGNEAWVVLGISPSVVELKSCVFNPMNAASDTMTQYSPERRSEQDVLEHMFYDENQEDFAGGLRERLGIPSYYTTDPQAEIIVVGAIDPSFITHIFYPCEDNQKKDLQQWAAKHFGASWADKFQPSQYFFRYRDDWNYWKDR